MAKDKKPQLPKGFLWGASTSAYQVEGGNLNQWSIWEQANAERLAKSAEKRLHWVPVWDQIKTQAQSPSNYINGQSIDHYNLYEQDFDLLKQLNLNAFRFGIEWSRIEPLEGQWDTAAIDHYKKYIADLKTRGITPVITLWHWTMPTWFADRGGFTKRRNIKFFVRFADRIAEELIAQCDILLTINEANSYIGMSYLNPHWPPQRRNPLLAMRVFYNLAVAHNRVYNLVKKTYPQIKIGVATQCNNNQPKRPNYPFDRLAAASANYFWNWWFLDRIKNHMDFTGFNYYFTDYFKGIFRRNPVAPHHHHLHTGHRGLHRKSRHNPPGPLSDVGWYMEPGGIYPVIMAASRRYKKPIIITETGVADSKDQYRQWWISETLAEVERANRHGADVQGYFVWSLLDNFEWSTGWWPKFGLAAVDRQNGMVRSLRPSAKWFAEQIKKS